MLSNVLVILHHQQQQHKIFLVVYNFSLFLFFWGVSFYDVCLRNKIKDTKLISLRASAVSYIQIVLIQFLFQFFLFFIMSFVLLMSSLLIVARIFCKDQIMQNFSLFLSFHFCLKRYCLGSIIVYFHGFILKKKCQTKLCKECVFNNKIRYDKFLFCVIFLL